MNISVVSVIIFFTVFSNLAFGKEKYRKLANCGTAVVTQGASCNEVKVQFEFVGCELNSGALPATKIECEGNTLKARHQSGPLRYEALFTRSEGAWGGSGWKPVGVVSEWKNQDSRRLASTKKKKVVKSAKSEPTSSAW